jgi:Myb-like DNA-binding domain
LQFPKDFRKIASFLRNKTTKDCVQFYYDSKQSVPYKGALREQVMRRKRRGDHNVWTSTAEAALSVGATVEAGTSEEKPLVFFLPERDDTYFTRLFHPMQREVYDAMVIDEETAADYDEDFDENSKSGTSRKRPREPLFTLDPEQSKFLKETTPPPSVKGASQSRSSMALTDGNLTDDGTKDDGGPTPMRRAPQKWSAHEKAVFLETLEKHGRNWSMLSQAIGTKTISQIKNYFYDYKKQAGRGGRSDKKSGGNGDSDDKTVSRDDDNMTPTPDDAGSIPPTHAEAQLSHNESDQGQVSDNSFHNLPLQPGQYQSHPLRPVHGPQHIHDSHYHHIGSGDLRMARALQQENERSIPQSGTSTPDRMDLWTQARHLQNEEAARQLLLQHHSQTQQQQILSTLLPWINSGHVGTNSLQDQQIQSYLHLQQQQQSTQNPYNSLAALGLGGLSGYGSAGLAGLGPQQHHQPQHRHNRQSSHEAQVALAQHLLNLHAQGNGSAADALGLLARLPDPNRNNNNNQGGNF